MKLEEDGRDFGVVGHRGVVTVVDLVARVADGHQLVLMLPRPSARTSRSLSVSKEVSERAEPRIQLRSKVQVGKDVPHECRPKDPNRYNPGRTRRAWANVLRGGLRRDREKTSWVWGCRGKARSVGRVKRGARMSRTNLYVD